MRVAGSIAISTFENFRAQTTTMHPRQGSNRHKNRKTCTSSAAHSIGIVPSPDYVRHEVGKEERGGANIAAWGRSGKAENGALLQVEPLPS